MKFLYMTRYLYSLFLLLKFPITSFSIRFVPQSTETISLSEVKTHLNRYGYLELDNSSSIYDFAAKFETALLRYQSNLGLSVTGKLNSETISQIQTPRCGLSDSHTSSSLSTLHGIFTTKRRYVYFPGKPRWARKIPAELTYAFSPEYTIGHLSPSEIRAAFRRAFARWSSVIPVSFSEAADYYGYVDIKIGFYGGDHGDSEPFDGALGVLAHSFSPESGRLHLDKAERWAVDGFRRERSPAAIDLESVATHEIGHLLGLGHSSVREAVMFPSLKPRETKLDLQRDDIEGVQALYGSNPNFSVGASSESDVSVNVNHGGRFECSMYWVGFVLMLL